VEPIAGDERRAVLGSLLHDEDAPGDQVGWQLADQPVGEAFVDTDGRAAVVVAGRFAVVYGAPRSSIGRFLYDAVFVGTVQGALAALDPTPIIEGIDDEFECTQSRVFFESRDVRPSTSSDIAPLVCRRPFAADDERLQASPAGWVCEMWCRPSDAAYVRALYDSDGGVLGLAASYAISTRYAEIAAWVDPLVAGNRLVAAQAEEFLGQVIEGGHWISSAILVQNAGANRFAIGAGWQPVAQQRVVVFPAPPAGSGRAWERIRPR
jgi:hypothetical protein